MNKFLAISMTIIFSGTAQGLDLISQQDIELAAQNSSTSIEFGSTSKKVSEVLLGAGNCIVGKNGAVSMTAFKCVASVNVKTVTIDPKGLFNKKTYEVEGSSSEVMVSRNVENIQVTNADIGKLINNTPDDPYNLDDILKDLQNTQACQSLEKAYSNRRHSDAEKEIIAQCFEL